MTIDPAALAGQLRELYLFEALDDEQIAWLVENGAVVDVAAGGVICAEGDPAECFWVLLSGEFAVLKNVRGDDIETRRSAVPGAYVGSNEAYVHDGDALYAQSLRAVADSSMFALPTPLWTEALRSWFPLAMHLLEGLFTAMRESSARVTERERLVALGSLTAGLTHELNNPASAAARAAVVLREHVAAMRTRIAELAANLDGPTVAELAVLHDEASHAPGGLPAEGRSLTALERTDVEDAVSDWLGERDVADAHRFAPILVAGGLDVGWLTRVAEVVPDGALASATGWIAYTVETESLVDEIGDATARVTALVDAARAYSQIDRAPFQAADVRELVRSTLVMMHGKLDGVTVVEEHEPDLPELECRPAELNQVWTNLIDNAVGAMDGSGTLSVSTRRDNDRIVVTVADTGPGIPEEIRPRIFEPFYTTKGVGEGTGLGLDISWRIVVDRHHGDILVRSGPTGTAFDVCLPFERPVVSAAPVPRAPAGAP